MTPLRVAVVGSGVAGLSCAWMLRDKHQVTLFESEPRFGGHAHSHEVGTEGAGPVLDSGFIVFNARTYPNLIRLFELINVRSRPSDMSFGVRCRRCRFEYSSRGLLGLFATPSLLARAGHYRLLIDIARFGYLGRRFLREPDASLPLGAFLRRSRLSNSFQRHFLLPMAGAVWSASFARVLDFDTGSFLRFFDNHGWLTPNGAPEWLTVEGGSKAYVARLIADLGPRARKAAPVASVTRTGEGVDLRLEGADSPQRFDRVVLACHADDALRILANPTAGETKALGAFEYSSNRTLLHDDAGVLPERRAAWASWNCDVADCRDEKAPVSMTYHLNRLQRINTSAQYCVTLNPQFEPKGRIFAEMTYAHPVIDRTAIRAQAALRDLSGLDRLHFAGAHMYNGFHEDGIRSAVDVARSLGVAF